MWRSYRFEDESLKEERETEKETDKLEREKEKDFNDDEDDIRKKIVMKSKEPCLILENRETEKEAKEEITSEDTTNSESEAIPILNQSKIEAKETEEISEIEAKMFVKDEKDLKEVNIKETKNEIVDKTDKIDVKVDKKDKSYTEEECLNALNETQGDSFIDATSS